MTTKAQAVQDTGKQKAVAPCLGPEPAGVIERPHELGLAGALLSLQRSHGNRFTRTLVNGLMLQRKCACGGKQGGALDEQEECAGCEGQSPTLRRRAVQVGPAVAPALVNDVLHSAGQPLDPFVRSTMESRFQHDFRQVRVHADSRAAESARAVNALAYTVGRDVVFGAGQYSPQSEAGSSLLAHELTHMVQQNGVGSPPSGPIEIGSPDDWQEQEADWASQLAIEDGQARGVPVSLGQGGQRLRRASFTVGTLTIQVDYGNVTMVLAPAFQSTIESLFTTWTGSPATTIHAALAPLSNLDKEWVLFGLDLLMDNTGAAHTGLNRVAAVQRLIARAPTSSTRPRGGLGNYDFEKEVLQVSGWFEVALAAPLTAPTGQTLTDIQALYNPPPGPSAPPAGALDVPGLNAQLPSALKALLNLLDPANWTATGTQSLGTLQAIADRLQAEARTFFAPYADTAITNRFSAGWHYSANLSSVTTMVFDHDDRISYLLNRAEIVGRRDTGGGSIFSNTNFDSSRPADRVALQSIVTAMEADPATQAQVDRLLKHTGQTNPSTGKVGVSTEFNLDTLSECQARWGTIRTLCHELVHALAHPSFTSRAPSIGFSQIIREGFTEVLGVDLYFDVATKAMGDSAFRSAMEAGIATAPCPSPPPTTVGYGAAGASAEQIRSKVGEDNFRAAYFLGAVKLAGLT